MLKGRPLQIIKKKANDTPPFRKTLPLSYKSLAFLISNADLSKGEAACVYKKNKIK